MGVELPSRVLVDSETARPRSGALTVLCAASFIARKGHTYLIQAVARLIEQGTKVRLLLAGDGELRSALEDQVARSNLSQWVAILGYVPHEKLLELYVREDIGAFVLPSLGLDGEGIPVSLMEAMAFGVPVISTETGGIPELLGGGAGIIVPPADPAALAAAIARLAADPDLRRRLGERGRERVEEAFSVQAVARCLAGWFAEGIEE
jgi:glycosyltransferase involved in cell wall biosynthesis